jgi:hypothetical protein
MSWLVILLDVVSSLPSLITLLREIMGTIQAKPVGDRAALEHDLLTALVTWKEDRDCVTLEKSLTGLGAFLGCPCLLPAAAPT